MAQTLLKAVADFSTQLAGTVEVGAESAQITSVTDKDGVSLVNDRLYGFTVDTGTRKEYFIGRLTVATRTLSQIVSISRQGVAATGFARKHRLGTLVQITDWALISRVVNILDGSTPLDAGTPLRYDGAPAQSEPNALATVQFVLDTASGGAVTFNKQIVGATAGVTIAAEDWVYLDEADGKWRLTKADDVDRSVGVKIGMALGAGTADSGIAGGVQVSGTETVGTYTPGARYYLSDTAGELSTTPGTNEMLVGVGDAGGNLLMFPNPGELTKDQSDAIAGGDDFGTPSTSNKFLTEDLGVSRSKISLTSGESINGGTLPVPVYQDKTDNEFYACDANDATKYKFIGFAVSNGTDGNPIDVQFNGVVTGFTGLAEGEKYYVSDTAGAISTTAGTQEILVGIAISETQLLIQKGKRYARGRNQTGTASGTEVVTCGFRPSVVRIFGQSITSDQPNCAMVWTPAGIIGSGIRRSSGNATYQSNPRVQIADSVYFEFSITSVTDTGFTITFTEVGISSSVAYTWEAEGEL